MSASLKPYRWQTDKKRQNLYQSEMAGFKGGFGGIFRLEKVMDEQTNNGRVAVIGKLKYDTNNWQTVIILYPHSYPYSEPRVYPIEPIQNFNSILIQTRRFGNTNQYSDNRICLQLSSDWSPDFGIGYILKKTQEWLHYANDPNGFPKDKIVKEIPGYFKHNGEVLVPTRMRIEENSSTKIISLSQFKPDHFIYSTNLLSSFPFRYNLGDQDFHCAKGPRNSKITDLMKAFTVPEFVKMLKLLKKEELLDFSGTYGLGVYLEDDPMPWHFFIFQVNNTGQNIQITSIKYLISKIVDEELFVRINGIFSNNDLAKSAVTIIGLGSIGSVVAESLAKNGVGRFYLFDKDKFELGNTVRHAGNLLHIGDRKTDVVKSLILQSNPNAAVEGFNHDVLDDDGSLEQSISHSDLVLVLAGENDVDFLINDHFATRFKVPFIFAGVSPGSFSGGIEVVDLNGPCLRCLTLQGLNDLPKPVGAKGITRVDPEYGNCSGPAVPGSQLDINTVALQVSRITIQHLQKNRLLNYPKVKGNVYRWHGPYGSENQDPFTWEINSVKKSKKCNVCNK